MLLLFALPFNLSCGCSHQRVNSRWIDGWTGCTSHSIILLWRTHPHYFRQEADVPDLKAKVYFFLSEVSLRRFCRAVRKPQLSEPWLRVCVCVSETFPALQMT